MRPLASADLRGVVLPAPAMLEAVQDPLALIEVPLLGDQALPSQVVQASRALLRRATPP
jgi:hypothetical protein